MRALPIVSRVVLERSLLLLLAIALRRQSGLKSMMRARLSRGVLRLICRSMLKDGFFFSVFVMPLQLG